MVEHGLKPEHKLLDVGCGPLRGGIKFINYLEPGNYYGVDKRADVIDESNRMMRVPPSHPVVVAGLQVVDELDSTAQRAAAHVEQLVLGLQSVLDHEVELQLAELVPHSSKFPIVRSIRR